MKERIINLGKHFIPSIIASSILLVVYLVKGIYPFGDMTIVQGDLFQMFSPFYMHLWDVIHEGASLIYDHNIGLGGNLLGWEVLFGVFSPITWLVGLTQRANIVNFLSWILLIRIGLIALTSYIFFNKIYQKVSNFYKTIFSVMFALSGYVLINYTNIIWLDNVILFPILILGIKKLIEEKKIWLYVLTLFLNLIICYQIAYTVIFGILSCMIIYILIYVRKEDRKKIVLLLGIGTVIALLLSSFLLVPGLTQSLNSYRLSGDVENEIENTNYLYKLSFLLLSPIAMVGFIGLQKYVKKDRNVICLNLMLLVTGILPIIVEKTNLFWHAGSYLSFPFRYGFISIFVLLNGGMYYFYKYKKEKTKESTLNKNLIKKILLYLIFFNFFICCAITFIPFVNHNMPGMFLSLETFWVLVATDLLLITEILISFSIKEKNCEKILISTIFIFSTVIFAFSYIGVEPEYRGGKEWSDEGLQIANNLTQRFNVEEGLYRYRDTERTMNENYPLITNMPSLSSWLHLVTTDQIDAHKDIGYSTYVTKIGDAGGTIFSDAILNVRYLFSKSKLDKEVLKYVGTSADNIKMYEYKEVLPIGLVYDLENKIEDIPDYYNPFYVQNFLYKRLTNQKQNILKEPKYTKKIEKTNIDTIKVVEYNIRIKEKSYLYFYMNQSDENYIWEIYVNDELLNIPELNCYENSQYPDTSNNGILNLGLYENEEIVVNVFVEETTYIDDIFFSTLDIKQYKEMFDIFEKQESSIQVSNNKIEMKVKTNGNNKTLFLPVVYDEGWTATINGEKVEISRIFNNYIGINLNKGENNIKLTFTPKNLKLGIIISVFTGVIILIYFVLRKFINKILDNAILQKFTYIIYLIITILFYGVVYIFSYINMLIDFFSK